MEELAKILVLGVFIACFIQLMRKGPSGPKQWFEAKFLGQVKS